MDDREARKQYQNERKASSYNPARVQGVAAFYTYEAINHIPEGRIFAKGSYTVTPEQVFIHFNKNIEEKEKEVNNGWKFHVSLDDEDFATVARGWDIIKDVLIKHMVATFKVVREGQRIADLSPKQRGKQITIYQFRDPQLNWQEIIADITRMLAEEGIKPGYAPPGDHAVPGTNYIYYRNDASLQGAYAEAGDVPGEKNPEFEKFQIQVNDQLPVKDWKPAAVLRMK